MGALALSEGFDHWILYGVGQPYVSDPTSEKAQHWWKHHGTFLYWLRKAVAQGVTITLDTPESNMFSHAVIADTERYPTPAPLASRYGYDMGIDRTTLNAQRLESYA
jgi:hypothetical protein